MRTLEDFPTVESLVYWIHDNINSKGINMENDDNFIFPPDIFEIHTGSCGDIASLIHIYCEKNNIPNTFIFTGRYYKNGYKEWSMGHVVCAYQSPEFGGEWIIGQISGVNDPLCPELKSPIFRTKNPTNDIEILAYDFMKAYAPFEKHWSEIEVVKYDKKLKFDKHSYVICNPKDLELIDNCYYNHITEDKQEILNSIKKKGKYYEFNEPIKESLLIPDNREFIKYNDDGSYSFRDRETGMVMRTENEEERMMNKIIKPIVLTEDLTKREYKAKYSNMEKFCAVIKTFDDLVIWMQINGVEWPEYGDNRRHFDPVDWDGPMHWPEEFLKDKVGNCFDQAIFVHYWCKHLGIKHRVYRFTKYYDFLDIERYKGHPENFLKSSESKYYCSSHFTNIISRKMGYYIFSYSGKTSDVYGPFDSYDEAASYYDHFILKILSSRILAHGTFRQFFPMDNATEGTHRRIISKYGYFTEKDFKLFDRLYGDDTFKQNQFIMSSEGCKFPEDSEVITHSVLELDAMILKYGIIDNLYNSRDRLLNESVTKDKYHHYYRNFDEFCESIKTMEEVVEWYKGIRFTWGKEKNSKGGFRWPDLLVRTGTGICFDNGLFGYYFCKRQGYPEATIVRTWIEYKIKFIEYGKEFEKVIQNGHIETYFKGFDKKWYIFKPSDERIESGTTIMGPYSSIEKAVNDRIGDYNNYYKTYKDELIKLAYRDLGFNSKYVYIDDITPFKYHIATDDEMKKFDKIYNNYHVGRDSFVSTYLNNFHKPSKGSVTMTFSSEKSNDTIWFDPSNFFEIFKTSKIELQKRDFKINDFEDFCMQHETPFEVGEWYVENKVRWPTDKESEEDRFIFPDELIRTKIGACFEHALLMHGFCNKKNIEHVFYYMQTNVGNAKELYGNRFPEVTEMNNLVLGHIQTIFKYNNNWYVFEPGVKKLMGYSSIIGPFESLEEYEKFIMDFFEYTPSVIIGKGKYRQVTNLSKVPEELHKEFDWLLKTKPKITQREFWEKMSKKYKNMEILMKFIEVMSILPTQRNRHPYITFLTDLVDFAASIGKMYIRTIIDKLKGNNTVTIESVNQLPSKIIPVDISNYHSKNRVICYNPHIGRTAMKALTKGAKNMWSSIKNDSENKTFLDSWDMLDLYIEYRSSIFALDIVSVDENQVLQPDLEGFPVIACDDGEVVNVVAINKAFIPLSDGISEAGLSVIIKHEKGTVTLYGHLQNGSITVKEGEKVHRGQVIGKVGCTGNTSIPHLHFETSDVIFGIGIQHSGFMPFKYTDLGGYISSLNKINFSSKYKEKLVDFNSETLPSAFFIT